MRAESHIQNTACGDGSHHADEVAHAHPGGGGDDEGLPAGDGAAVDAAALGGHPQHFGEQADGQKPGADGEIDAGGDQKQHQQGKAHASSARKGNGDQIAPEKGAGSGDEVHDKVHEKQPPDVVMGRKTARRQRTYAGDYISLKRKIRRMLFHCTMPAAGFQPLFPFSLFFCDGQSGSPVKRRRKQEGFWR